MKKVIILALLVFAISSIIFATDTVTVKNVFVCNSDELVTIYIIADLNGDGHFDLQTELWKRRTVDNYNHTIVVPNMYPRPGYDNIIYAVQGNRETPKKHISYYYPNDNIIAFETAENCPPGQSNY